MEGFASDAFSICKKGFIRDCFTLLPEQSFPTSEYVLSEEKVQKIEIKSVIAILFSRAPIRTLELSSAKSELFTAGCRLQLQGGYGKYQLSKLLSF